MNTIRMRRRHKTSIRMLQKKSHKQRTEGSSEDPEEYEDDNSFSTSEEEEDTDSLGSTASNPFGYVQYCTNHHQNHPPRTSPVTDSDGQSNAGTFIDHCADCTKDVFDAVARAKTDALKVERDSQGNICFTHFKDLERIDDNLRDSMPLGSSAVRLKDSRSQSKDIVHTSTAQIRINQLPTQDSEALSSFDQGTTVNKNKGANYEDLSKLDDSMPMKIGLRQRTLLEERHSMPTLFVGNRFNSISATKIYIPSWKDKQDMQNSATNCSEVGKEGLDDCVVDEEEVVIATNPAVLSHSSSVDVPCDKVLTLPDKITAELLYNLSDSTMASLDECNNAILKPPSMFKNETPSLSRDVSPFAKHNLNSDKRVSSISSTSSSNHTPSEPKRNSRRCLSYRYVNLHNGPPSDNNNNSNSSKAETPSSDTQPNTTSGTSARSSDSGMAGSYTLPSPDPPKVPDEFFYAYEFDDSPEDCMDQAGTSRDPPRSSGLQHSQSTHNLGRVNMIVASSSRGIDIDQQGEDEGDVTDSGQYGDEGSLMKDFNEKYPYFQYSEEPSISRGRTVTRTAESSTRSRSMDQRQRASNYTDTIVINIGDPHVNVIRLGGTQAPSMEKTREETREGSLESSDKDTVFRTGLYAHWWKKEKLPNEIIKELMLKPNHGNSSKTKKTCRKHNKGCGPTKTVSCQTSIHRQQQQQPPLLLASVKRGEGVTEDSKKGSGKQRLLLCMDWNDEL